VSSHSSVGDSTIFVGELPSAFITQTSSWEKSLEVVLRENAICEPSDDQARVHSQR
jgi:hypothetical protein